MSRVVSTDSSVFDAYGNYINWKQHFKDKEIFLDESYEVVNPYDFVHEILPSEYLDFHISKEDLLQMTAFKEGTGQDTNLHSGRGTGILKYTLGTNKKGMPITKSVTLYDDYQGIGFTQNNKFALINLCTYFGKNIYRKNTEDKFVKVKSKIPSLCFGIAIDLDYVQLTQLKRVFGRIENDMMPIPTYLVNSGAGLHIYYIFEQPVPLKDLTMQRYLLELKRQLTEMIWVGETSLCPARQYQGIYQDMRIPGSWTKFGYKNKKRCKYIIKAYRVGDKVDLTYLERFCDKTTLPNIVDLASFSEQKISLEECASLYPKWYDKYVLNECKKGRLSYVQHRGLYKWWLSIITKENVPSTLTSHTGNRFFCIRILFVMAKKSGVPFEEVLDDAYNLIPFMNTKAHDADNVFTKDDVNAAAKFYEDNYVCWSNKTIKDQTGIDIYEYRTSRRNGRSRSMHLKIARATRDAIHENWRENNGRKSLENIVKEWKEKNPEKNKASCIKETGLSKPTVYRWW